MPKLSVDRLDHLALVVRDMDATCAFYRQVLGIEVETFGRGRIALRLGRQKINLEHARALASDQPTPGPGHLCFVTDRKSTRLNSSHGYISYAVFCLKKKKKNNHH